MIENHLEMKLVGQVERSEDIVGFFGGQDDGLPPVQIRQKRLEFQVALARCHVDLGQIYSNKGDADAAIADFTEAIRCDARCARAYHDRGRAYERNGERAKAQRDFAQAKRLGYR